MSVYRSACVIALALAPLGCGLFGEGSEVKTYEVNHYRLECSGVAVTLCLLVRESEAEDFTFMYETPRGFEYEWGYLYEIEVEERELSEVPADASTIRRTLRRAIENCGTTFSDFQDARGVEGSYQQFLGVYDREGEHCRRCGESIRRVVQQQRSTYHCPGCQL